MKVLIVLTVAVVVTISVSAQVTARRALQPLTKQGVLPAPPPLKIPAPTAAPATATPVAARPATAAPAIDPTLKPSAVSLFGKVDGLAGTLYVTNTGAKPVAPFVQLAVVDKSGRPVGYVTNSAPAIEPNHAEKISVLSTNRGAVDFKVVRLTAHK
jgi:hypothetical protein